MNFVLIVAVLNCSHAIDWQAEAEAAFRAGIEARSNDTLARPMFRKSAEAYEQLRRQGADHTSLHRNEGNARILAGDIAGAIMAYHRGFRLDPDDTDLRQSLAHARNLVAYASPEDRQRFSPRDRSSSWPSLVLRSCGLIVLTVLTILASTSASIWLTTRRNAWLVAATASLIFALLWTGARIWQTQFLAREATAVVVQPAFLRTGNATAFPLRHESPLPAGVEATIRVRRGMWVHVELADGTIGWLPTRAAEEP